MSSNENSTMHSLEKSSPKSHEIDFSPEAVSQLLPPKLLAMYPDAKIDVIQPTRVDEELTILISSPSTVLEKVSLTKSILAEHDHGLLYFTIKFLYCRAGTIDSVFPDCLFS